ncbi:helicase associated domain-containing protein [Streptomyces lavendulocolor]|uniref:helicase associated domain-containing protein n=1 Tax=Streptomyces TaxID=1883 RepID=UPI003C303FB1
MSPVQSPRPGSPGRGSYRARPPAPNCPSPVASATPVSRRNGSSWAHSASRPRNRHPRRRPGAGRATAWERRVAAARAYLTREGTLAGVSRAHVERVQHDVQEHAVKLGVWLSSQRSRRATLPADRVAVLKELGVV